MRKLGFPLILTILVTIGFNCLPIVLGRGLAMYGAFAFYTGFVYLLAQLDKRVMGYAMVLTLCSSSGGLAPLSYGLVLAILIAFKESAYIRQLLPYLTGSRWWLLFALAALVALVSVAAWPHDPRDFMTAFKEYVSRLGFIVIFCLAIAATIPTAEDGLRLVWLACAFTVATVSLFYFVGETGIPSEYIWNVGINSSQVYQHIGEAYMNFNRTQVCILLAVVAAASMALGVATFPRLSSLLILGVTGMCVYLIMQLASTGSAFAMVVGMGVAGLGFVFSRPSAVRILVSIALLMVLGTSLVYAVFQTDNYLAKRIDLKQRAGQIDRLELWKGAADKAMVTPLGGAWTTEFAPQRHTHNDYLCYFLSFGWLGGLLYFVGNLFLGAWFVIRLRRLARDATATRALVLVGLAALTVYGVNSMLDTLSANLGSYQMVWGIILIAATVATLEDRVFAQERSLQREWGTVVNPVS